MDCKYNDVARCLWFALSSSLPSWPLSTAGQRQERQTSCSMFLPGFRWAVIGGELITWPQCSPLIGAGCVPGDWSAGLRGGGDCGPADAPDRGLAVPGPVPGAGGDAACLLRLHWAGAVWLHPLLLGPGSWHGQGVQDEARGDPGPSYQGTSGRWLKSFCKLWPSYSIRVIITLNKPYYYFYLYYYYYYHYD